MRIGCAALIVSLNAAALGCGAGPAASGATDPRSSDPSQKDRRSVEARARVLEAIEGHAERLASELEALKDLRLVGMDEGPVPSFEVRATSGAEYDSERLVGREPFVIAFFATWCDACTTKLRSLRRALTKTESMLVIPVSVDGPETRSDLRAYLRELDLRAPVVLAAEHPLFAFSYNPFDTVPLLVIVGRNGGLVDYQLGYEPEHEQRLVASLRLAHAIGPLAAPHDQNAESSL